MKLQKTLSRVLDGLILLVFLLFLSSAGFHDSRTSGWYQQWFPNLNGGTIKDITFLDSLTGFAVTTTNSSVQAYILKTTNGGDNWDIIYTYIPPSVNSEFNRIQFVNSNTGFTSTNYFDFFKTTDGGLNWTNHSNQPTGAEDFSAINKDTLFYVYSGGFGGGVYRSINGGINWTRIWTNGTSDNPDKIYMYDKNIGFSCVVSSISHFRKTTNGGFNWFEINPTDAFLDIKFVDTLTGWKGSNRIQKTTDGGLTWFLQTPPNVSSVIIRSISMINKDTVWLGGTSFVGVGSNYYGVLIKTTNGGTNWGYQIPNIAIHSRRYKNINFINSNNGWAYVDQEEFNDGIHTKVVGNDTTYYTGIKLVPNFVPEVFSLGQNYPNPFNPSTNIQFELKEPSHITLKVYDVQGREVKELVNGRWGTGRFIADFDATDFSTGVYFYKIIINGETTRQTFSETKRMVLIK
ncbi:MAG: T9SS type A sorting domain-containing protein [Ignavibacteria bacterium]